MHHAFSHLWAFIDHVSSVWNMFVLSWPHPTVSYTPFLIYSSLIYQLKYHFLWKAFLNSLKSFSRQQPVLLIKLFGIASFQFFPRLNYMKAGARSVLLTTVAPIPRMVLGVYKVCNNYLLNKYLLNEWMDSPNKFTLCFIASSTFTYNKI